MASTFPHKKKQWTRAKTDTATLCWLCLYLGWKAWNKISL